MRTHQEIDRRSLELHRLVSTKLRAHPELYARVEATLARWRLIADRSTQPYIAEWERIVSGGLESALLAACDDSERAKALRQCSPFCGVLTHQERSNFLRAWRHANAES